MGKLIPLRRRELPEDPLKGRPMMPDCGGAPPRKTPPGRLALTILLCIASLAVATACAGEPKLIYIIPLAASAACVGISRRL